MGKLALRTVWAAAALGASAFQEGAALKTENGQDGVLAAHRLEIEENDRLSSPQFLENENSDEGCAAHGKIASLGPERLISLTSVETAGTCQKICNETAVCLAAVYQASDSVCHLLKEIRDLQSANNTVLVLPSCDDRCFKVKKTLKGQGTRIGEAPSAIFCQALCASTADCAAFSWNVNTNECLSFSSNSGYKGSSRFISGERNSCTTRTRRKNYAGSCSRGNLASNTEVNVRVSDDVHSFAECHELCLTTAECNWANYVANENRCYMKKRVGQLKELKEVTTGPKFCDSSCFWKDIRLSTSQSDKVSGVHDAHHCHYECMQSSSCNHWTYDEGSGDCMLSTDSLLTGVHESGFWTGIKGGCGSEAEYSERSSACALQGVKYSGQALETSKQHDALACQDFCKENDHCKAFTFNVETKECSSFPASAVNTREQDSKFISGARVCDQPCFENNVQRSGTGVASFANGAGNADECKLRCQASNDCTHFTYSPNTHDCLLFKNAGTSQAAGMISGPKSCNVHEEVSDGQDGCDVVGFEAPHVIWSKTLNNKSLQDCRNECKSSGDCTNFTYYQNERKCLLADWFSLRAQRPNSNATLGFKSCSRCIRSDAGYKATSPEFLFGTIAQNAEECRQRCDLQQLCYRFSYNKADKTCSMFSGSPSDVERGPNLYSGPYRCAIERGCLQYGTRIKSGNLLSTTAISDEGQCQEWCGAHALCTWFSWTGGECKLYNGQVELEGHKGVVVGPKKCMRDVKDSELCEEHGLEFDEGPVREVRGIRYAPICASECRREPRCRLWTLNVQFFYANCVLMNIGNFRRLTYHDFKKSAPTLGCPRCIRQGMANMGNIIKIQEYNNVIRCQMACEFEPSCTNFTFAGKQCTLRSTFEKAIAAGDSTYSGPKQC